MPYPGDSLYIAGLFTDPNVAKKISAVGVSSYADLYCSHEEADKKMLLHAMHADKEFGRKNTKGRTIENPLIQMFSYFVYISFHPCQIPKNYGFKLELLPGPKTVDATYLSMI